MPFFKKFGNKKSKSKDTANAISSKSESKSAQNPSSPPRREDDDLADIDLEKLNLPFPADGRKARNLSISRSGRHKMKSRQRVSVTEDVVYNSSPVRKVSNSPSRPIASNSIVKPRDSPRSQRIASKVSGRSNSPLENNSLNRPVAVNSTEKVSCRGVGVGKTNFQNARAAFATRTPTAV